MDSDERLESIVMKYREKLQKKIQERRRWKRTITTII